MVWQSMPIYSDEFSMRIEVGRFLQDRGLSSSLFSLCVDSIKSVPLLFVIPAWLLSQMDLHFTSVQIRALPFVVVLCGSLFTAYYALRNINPFAALWIAAAMIGVACSALVFARYESIMFINLFFGVLALHMLSYRHVSVLQRGAVAALLIASALASLFVHPQGIMFLPFTAYLSYRLIARETVDIQVLCIWVIGVCFIGYTSIAFHSLSCSDYPAIEAYVAKMALQPEGLQSTKFVEYVMDKFTTYVGAFTYNHSYTVFYLPGISAERITASGIVTTLNNVIPVIVVGVAVLNVVLGIGLGIVAFIHYIIKRKVISGINTDAVIAYFLILLPVIFLFFYDAKQYFYRSIVIHFLFTIALVIIVSNLRYGLVTKLTAWLGGGICLVCLGSIITNHTFFDKELEAYEGPGVSVKRNLGQHNFELQEVVKACGINLADGGAVIGDLTYDSVKQYNKVYPITYLGLQEAITGISANDMMRLLKPNYVLARCSEMRATGIGWPADVNNGKLCCTRLNK